MMYIKDINRLLLSFCLMSVILVLASCSSKPKSTITGTKPYTVRGEKYYPLQSAHGYDEEGIASWYGPGFHGKTTANGETYNQNAMTAAHTLLPLGTNVRVTNLENHESVELRINDRGPFVHDRIIDVSKRAAQRLGMETQGTARVRVEAINTKPDDSSSEEVFVSSATSSSAAIAEAKQSRVLNEQGEIPDELKYLFEDEGYTHDNSVKNTNNSQTYSQQPEFTDVSNAAGGANVVYYIQVGAFEVKKFASLMAAKLKERGYPARSFKEGTQKIWRVRIGPWSSAHKAEDFLQKLAHEFPEASIVEGVPKQF